MITFTLRGLPEGIVGRSSVEAESIDDLFRRYPALNEIKGKGRIVGAQWRDYSACDG